MQFECATAGNGWVGGWVGGRGFTWVLPSGRTQSRIPFLRTSVRRAPMEVARRWVRGMSSSVSSVA